MFTLETLILFIVFAIAAAATLSVQKRQGVPMPRLLCIGLFFLALFGAYLLKRSNTTPTVSAPIPLYKLFAIDEYGYKGVFNDLLAYALPFLAAGIFRAPAFPKCGLFSALFTGVLSAVFLNLYPLFNDAPFIADEYLFAGLGCMAGYSIYALLAALLKRFRFPERFGLAWPSKRANFAAFLYVAVLYFGIAFVMILDHGETYAPIQFFESETPLPKAMTLDCTLDTSGAKVKLYGPSTQSIYERAYAIALALGIEAPFAVNDSVYTAETETARLTITESGSWTYDLLSEPAAGRLPTEVDAIRAVFDLFERKTLLTVSLDSVTDVVPRHDASNSPVGYDIYLSTAIDGKPIIGSSTLVVSVRADSTITKIRRYDGDVISIAEKQIISQQRAYEKLQSGDCAYTLFTPAVSATIDNCYLAYMANSSQGYYLPVWVFSCTATLEDGTTAAFDIYVEAMR